MKKIALSGIQTSGTLHLGNYLGSIHNWLNMQDEYKCYFFLADLHSITIERSPEELRESIFHTAAIYLATGIDPNKSTIFMQSSVSYHAEMAWLFNCVTPIGWLKRMTQFKDKAGKQQDSANTGLFTYPLLMAADILLYQANVVPVGEDQKQHLELTRDIAGAINRKFNKELLVMPEPLITGPATRVMSLRDGTKKMSKSDESDASRINLTDDPEIILQKLRKAKTDSINEIAYEPETRPDIANLLDIFTAFSARSQQSIASEYHNSGFAKFKNDLAELVIANLEPMQTEYKKLIADKSHLVEILQRGADDAKSRAEKTYLLLKNAFGFYL